jgi:hypothetical protein
MIAGISLVESRHPRREFRLRIVVGVYRQHTKGKTLGCIDATYAIGRNQVLGVRNIRQV